MNRLIISTLAALALAACSSPPKCGSPDAQGVVTALQPENQFEAMLKMAVGRTQTVAMAATRDGSSARTNLSKAVDAAAERHGANWERNMVASWAMLKPAELEQVCAALNDGNQSAFLIFATRVGGDVKLRNEPLLERAAVEVLDEIWSKDK